MKFLLAKKIGMTQVFDPAGHVVPVTLVETGPLVVIREKTPAADGYQSIQVGFGSRREKRISRAERGAWKGLGNFAMVREIRNLAGKARGDTIGLDQFQEGEVVKVSGISKSKGFQGGVKRYGFHGKDATHGTKHAHREPGSIGGSGGRAGGRVAKGMRMAGRMGGDRVTLKTVTIVRIDPEKYLVALKGAIPGRRGTLIEIHD